MVFASIVNLSAQEITLNQAVNIAGKQRMLCQRMAKDKLFIEVNKISSKAEKEQKAAILAFESGLSKLKTFAPNKVIEQKVDVAKYAFRLYRKAIVDKSKKSMEDVIETNTIMLNICNDLVVEIVRYAKNEAQKISNKREKYMFENVARATNASGKLRYLTQRLSFYYSINNLQGRKEYTSPKGQVSDELILDIIKTMDEKLNYLTILNFNTMEIDEALSKVIVGWNKLKNFIDPDGNNNILYNNLKAEEAYDLLNNILSDANSATKMYADLKTAE